MYKLSNTNYLHTKKEKLQYRSTYLHILQLHLSPFQAFMPFLNLNTFSTLFIVSGMELQRMLPRNARDFMPKYIVLVGGICSVFLIRRSYVSSLCTKNSPINDVLPWFNDLYTSVINFCKFFVWMAISLFLVRRHSKVDS